MGIFNYWLQNTLARPPLRPTVRQMKYSMTFCTSFSRFSGVLFPFGMRCIGRPSNTFNSSFVWSKLKKKKLEDIFTRITVAFALWPWWWYRHAWLRRLFMNWLFVTYNCSTLDMQEWRLDNVSSLFVFFSIACACGGARNGRTARRL